MELFMIKTGFYEKCAPFVLLQTLMLNALYPCTLVPGAMNPRSSTSLLLSVKVAHSFVLLGVRQAEECRGRPGGSRNPDRLHVRHAG